MAKDMHDSNKVFISYRRASSWHFAELLFRDLSDNGFDAFLDARSIDSGDFEREIFGQIESRPHFLLVLMPGAVSGLSKEGDWLRMEIEYAIEHRRNIVPLLVEPFDFDSEEYVQIEPTLSTKLKQLRKYNSVKVPSGYFDSAMSKLRERFLKAPARGKPKANPKVGAPVIEKTPRNALTTASALPVFSLAGHLKMWPVVAGLRLTEDAPELFWSAFRASMYVVEASRDEAFQHAWVVYQGSATELNLPDELERTYYRVVAMDAAGDHLSTWSNTQVVHPRPAAPRLAIRHATFASTLEWSEVQGAGLYELARSVTSDFQRTDVAYNGVDREFALNMVRIRAIHDYYRVRVYTSLTGAKSQWSNVVRAALPSGWVR